MFKFRTKEMTHQRAIGCATNDFEQFTHTECDTEALANIPGHGSETCSAI